MWKFITVSKSRDELYVALTELSIMERTVQSSLLWITVTMV